MNYVKIESDSVSVYPYTLNQLRTDFPTVSLPRDYPIDALATLDVYPVIETTPPAFDPDTQKLVELIPTGSGSTWTQQWSVVALDADELKEVKVRKRPGTAEQRVKNILNVPAVKAMKTLPDAQAYIDANVSDLASAKVMLARLTYMMLNLGRAQYSRDGTIFPDDE